MLNAERKKNKLITHICLFHLPLFKVKVKFNFQEDFNCVFSFYYNENKKYTYSGIRK